MERRLVCQRPCQKSSGLLILNVCGSHTPVCILKQDRKPPPPPLPGPLSIQMYPKQKQHYVSFLALSRLTWFTMMLFLSRVSTWRLSNGSSESLCLRITMHLGSWSVREEITAQKSKTLKLLMSSPAAAQGSSALQRQTVNTECGDLLVWESVSWVNHRQKNTREMGLGGRGC